MIKVRLVRLGKKNDPFYRVVAIEHTNKNIGEALEILGYYHPVSKKQEIDKKGIEAWVKKGAQVSEAVVKMLK